MRTRHALTLIAVILMGIVAIAWTHTGGGLIGWSIRLGLAIAAALFYTGFVVTMIRAARRAPVPHDKP